VTVNSKLAQVKEYLNRFDCLISALSDKLHIETVAPRIHILNSQRSFVSEGQAAPPKDVVLTISALTHGVEVGGLAVLVELLELVTRGQVPMDLPFGVALGNIPAAENSVRFVERDLNRSFGRESTKMLEEKRADDLEKLFSRTQYLLDIHQVKLEIDRPFWIFPYTHGGYQFARAVAADVSVITHWGRGFSQDGQCSDEWVNGQGGVGVTIELGQNGFDPDQIKKGLEVCLSALSYASEKVGGQEVQRSGVKKRAPLYTWGEIIAYPPTGKPVLNPGWHNFKFVKAGEVIGSFSGEDIKATVTGPVLFPKYPEPRPDGSYADVPPAAELIRVLREISEAELPKG
jgi:succinylglutamate desuccinylase